MSLGPISQASLSVNSSLSVDPKISEALLEDAAKLVSPGGDASDLFSGKASTLKLDDVAGLYSPSSRSGRP